MTNSLLVNAYLKGTWWLWYLANIRTVIKVWQKGLIFDSWETVSYAANVKKWEKWYLPPGGVQGKTIMCIGARCGGDVWFFFQHGAKKVIAVERDPDAVSKLRQNIAKFGWNCEVVDRGIELSDFDRDYDFAEMNAEGYEMILLDYPGKLKPMALEAHCQYIQDKLSAAGFKITDGPFGYLGKCIMANW